MIVKKYAIEPSYKNSSFKKITRTDKEIAEIKKAREARLREEMELRKAREDRYKASDIYNPFQEAHSPTVDIAGEKSQHICRRRVQDVRVQDRIDEVNGNVAAIRIARAYNHIIHGLSSKVSSAYVREYERKGLENMLSDGDWLDYLNKCVTDYKKWRELYDHKCINCEAVLDVVYNGLSFDAVTRKFRKRNGWASDNLIDGLELYNRMEGF